MVEPDWTRWLVIVPLAMVSVTCLFRLFRRGDEPPWHEDVGQVAGGIGMIAMVMSWLGIVPLSLWVAVFGAQAAGFGTLVFLPGRHVREAVHHLMGSLAMIYMIVAGMRMNATVSPLAGAFGMYFLLYAGWSVARAATDSATAGTMLVRRPVVIEACRAVMNGCMAYLLFA